MTNLFNKEREEETIVERDRWWEEETLWKDRAEKAEAERDELGDKLMWLSQIAKDNGDRVSELEEALKLYWISLGFVEWWGDKERETVRRALGEEK